MFFILLILPENFIYLSRHIILVLVMNKRGKKKSAPKPYEMPKLFEEEHEEVSSYKELDAQNHIEAVREEEKMERYKEASKLRKKAAEFEKKAAFYHRKYKEEMEKVAKYQAYKAKYKDKEHEIKQKIKELKRRIEDYQMELKNAESLKKRGELQPHIKIK
ncbi:hypothetical protein Aboo_1163 [Aciduliprofundum boonei T469]|uniref:Uncharacterized protein n=2 Tax=Candidatus Aciduliprofundum boonei TaxID=379547 RepID=D3TA43_ACIB4|nr:hypothetical protein Aboo_1163 [Aciduliprofundum boonei T469]